MIQKKSQLAEFYELYSHGDFLGAVSTVLKSPDIEYDLLQHDYEDKYWLDYIDSLVFRNYSFALDANKQLQKILSISHEDLRFDELILVVLQANPQELQEALKNSEGCHSAHQLLSIFLAEKLQQSCDISLEEDKFSGFLAKQHSYSQNLVKFARHKGKIYDLTCRPYLLISYPTNKEIAPWNKTPIFVMEAYRLDWQKILEPCQGKPAIFVFYNTVSLCHCLQFDAVLEALIDQNHSMLILESYPFLENNVEGDFEVVMIADIKEQLLEETLLDYFSLPKKLWWEESPEADDLYLLGKKINLEMEMHRLGKSRILALDLVRTSREWWEQHRGLGKRNIELPDYFKDFIKNITPNVQRRKVRSRRIAHIVHRLVDQGYAPTKRVKSLLSHYDHDKYDLHVVVTENCMSRCGEYPSCFDILEKTEPRARQTIQEFKNQGIQLYIDDAQKDFMGSANNIVDYLSEQEIDVVVFHDTSTLAYLIAQQCDVPQRLFYVHGVVPKYPSFDTVILGFEEEKKHYSGGGNVVVNPVSINLALTEREGLDVDGVILTTVSNMLKVRLTMDMCMAISEILQRCPGAYYMPIGYIEAPQCFYQIFNHYGVGERVIFLGEVYEPNRYLQSMDIYLNEFPFGSGLAVLESMAAGCAVVTMYDEKSNYKSREGGNYFGPEYAIKTGLRKDYVDLACHLVEDDAMRKSWSEHALKRYSERTGVEEYAQRHMQIIEECIQRDHGKINKSLPAGASC
jgi:glycosyltransferase involved in cell wall biosynthesis